MPHTRSPPYRRKGAWLPLSILYAILTLALASRISAQQSAADFYVSDLPGAPLPLLKSYAGHIEITPEHHGNLFFWFFKNKHIGARQRTVIWLNGGPGCSSMDGALMEIGPYRVNEDGTLRYNEGSWNEFANVLFVDNPVGTGFSFVDTDSYIHDLDEMADQLIAFLEKWFAIFPEYADDELYIAGESYAGQHIPYIASHILARNENLNRRRPKWNLRGLMIGNGWISGEDQYSSYIPFMKEAGLLKDGSQADNNAQRQWDQCQNALNAGSKDKVDTPACEMIMLGLSRDIRGSDQQCWNVYDVRLKDTYPSCGMNWPPDLAQVTPYLRRDDVLRAIHISPDRKTGWTECNSQVNRAFNAAHSKPSKTLLPDLLKEMPIVLFSGDKDLICNHIGTENLIVNLEWNGEKGMMGAPAREWTFDSEPAGQWQTARNLTYLRFYNSSHMVPFDYPKRAQDMLHRVMGLDVSKIGHSSGQSYIDGEDKDVVTPQPDTPQSPEKPTPSQAPDLTPSSAAEKEKIDAAAWAAYQRSGEAALAVVAIAAVAWGFFVWRDRRRRRKGYRGVQNEEFYDDDAPDAPRRRAQQDVEAAREFDEAELDDLTPGGKDRYAVGDEEDEEESGGGGRANGHVT